MKSNKNHKKIFIIDSKHNKFNYWKDFWEYRELLSLLSWRNISVQYKQTIIGFLWSFLRPLLTLVVLTVIFGHVAGLESDGGAPYSIMVLAGMLPWLLFSTSLNDASNSLINNAELVSKIYFPRIIMPISAMAISILDFCISLIILLFLLIIYNYWPGWQIILLPFFVVMAFLTSLGPSLWMASMNVKYRDFQYIIPFAVQFGLYISPVGFSSSVVPEGWRLLYSLNPMVGVIDGFRWCILGGDSPIYVPGFIMSILLMIIFLYLGIKKFKKEEKAFADLI